MQAPDLRGRVRPRERGGAGRLGDAESVAAGLVTDGAYLRGGGGFFAIPWGPAPSRRHSAFTLPQPGATPDLLLRVLTPGLLSMLQVQTVCAARLSAVWLPTVMWMQTPPAIGAAASGPMPHFQTVRGMRQRPTRGPLTMTEGWTEAASARALPAVHTGWMTHRQHNQPSLVAPGHLHRNKMGWPQTPELHRQTGWTPGQTLMRESVV